MVLIYKGHVIKRTSRGFGIFKQGHFITTADTEKEACDFVDVHQHEQ